MKVESRQRQEASISTTTNDLDPRGFIIGVVIVAAFANKYILPKLPVLKSEFIALFFNWVFYAVLFVLLLISLLCCLAYLKRKTVRLRLKEIAEEQWRKKREEEEKREKERNTHLYQPKPVYVPVVKVQEKPQERKSINVNLNKEFHKRKNYNKYEIEYFISQDYQEFKYKSICTGKVENYLLKSRFNESSNHMIVIYDLEEYLKKKKIDVEKYTTKMPDLVITIGRKKIAIEVETGTVIKNMKKFNEKMRLLKENYEDNFYFIVTNRNLIKKYRKYGKVIDPRYIKGQIDKIIRNAQK